MAAPKKRTIEVQLPSDIDERSYARLFHGIWAMLPVGDEYGVTPDRHHDPHTADAVWADWTAEHLHWYGKVNGDGPSRVSVKQ